MPKKLDKLIGHITHEYEGQGMMHEEAESIARATATKRGWVKREGDHEKLTEKGEEVTSGS